MPETRSCTRIVLFVFCVIAWACSIVSVAHCSFIILKTDSDSIFSVNTTTRTLRNDYPSFGIFSFQDASDYCIPYDDTSNLNAAGKTSRAFGVLAVLCSGIALALLTAVILFVERGANVIWKVCLVLLSFSIPFQCLTFLALLTDICQDAENCTIGVAGIMSAIGVAFLIVVTIMIGVCVKPPERPVFPISELQEHPSTKMRWAIFAISILAWILSMVVVADCTLVRGGTRETSYNNLDDFGLFRVNTGTGTDEHRCVTYSKSTTFDASAKTARAFGTIAAIACGYVMVLVVCIHLFLSWQTKRLWRMVRVLVLVATVAQALVFTVFATDDCVDAKCLPGPAGILGIVNVMLLAILTWLCWGSGPPNALFEIKRRQVDPTRPQVTSAPDHEESSQQKQPEQDIEYAPEMASDRAVHPDIVAQDSIFGDIENADALPVEEEPRSSVFYSTRRDESELPQDEARGSVFYSTSQPQEAELKTAPEPWDEDKLHESKKKNRSHRHHHHHHRDGHSSSSGSTPKS